MVVMVVQPPPFQSPRSLICLSPGQEQREAKQSLHGTAHGLLFWLDTDAASLCSVVQATMADEIHLGDRGWELGLVSGMEVFFPRGPAKAG